MQIRSTADIKDKWPSRFRGELGGFGIGTDLTWQLQAYAGYRFTSVLIVETRMNKYTYKQNLTN